MHKIRNKYLVNIKINVDEQYRCPNITAYETCSHLLLYSLKSDGSQTYSNSSLLCHYILLLRMIYFFHSHTDILFVSEIKSYTNIIFKVMAVVIHRRHNVTKSENSKDREKNSQVTCSKHCKAGFLK